LVSVLALLPAAMACAVELKLHFPQNRTVFQTNEQIDVSVIRTDEGALPAGNVTLVLKGENTTMTFVFGLKAGSGSATDHLHLNGWLIKPGTYTLTASMGNASDKQDIEVFSHIRKSTYKTIHWGGPNTDAGMTGEGEAGLGFNLMMGGVTPQSIREGMDIMGTCTMGGMHQHDGNLECDWSDPYVTIGAIQRGMDVTMAFRTMPNFIGSHLHDEPGLTWNDHPFLKDKDGKPAGSPHDIASQRRAYQSAFDKEQTWVQNADTKTPAGLADWTQISDFKLGYMSAFWKASRDAVERIKPGALAVTQSQYGWTALYDGYYFNVVASMSIVSGHGGYNDFWLRNFNPSFFLEFALPRQLDKPTWYLPSWYGSITNDQCRLEQYMSFITGIQGIAIPPEVTGKSPAAQAVEETNKVAARLGTIFTTPAYTRQPLAVLYSKSDSYFHKEVKQHVYLPLVYMATKLIQQPINVVVEEDILDGSVAESHKAILVVGVQYLDPAVVAALADFAKTGLVLVGDEVKVNIPGATKLGYSVPDFGDIQYTKYQAALKNLPEGEAGQKARAALDADLLGFGAWVDGAKPLADVLKTRLTAAKIAPAFGSDNPLIAPGRQVRGEIEYILAVNYAYAMDKEKGGVGIPVKTTATITMTDDGRTTYDAMKSGEVKLNKGAVKVDFAPGDMKVFARTARPIGGVLVFAPVFNTDLTREGAAPISMTLAAALMDDKGKAISGTAPLQIVVKDPAGKVRYDLFRATEAGVCSVELPLAANDAAGKWTVEVTDLLAGKKGTVNFDYKPLTRSRNLAGATHRAVFFGDDKANIYRFFRDHRNVTIAIGDSAYNKAAAERLVTILKPYNVTCDIVLAKDIPARELSELEARTWCGTNVAGQRKNAEGVYVGVQPGRVNSPQSVGWDLKNPTIVLGTPEDNVMIKHLAQDNRNMLPYRVSATFPGKGNGMVAWNIHALGHDVHAVACVAYDAEGMSQAVGTLFEIMAGIDPLFPLALPSSATIEMTK